VAWRVGKVCPECERDMIMVFFNDMVRDEKANPDIGALPRVFDKTPGKHEIVSISCLLSGKAGIGEHPDWTDSIAM